MVIESNSKIQRSIDFATHTKFISVKKKGQTRYVSMKKYKSKQFRLQKSESDFFLRACNIMNALNDYFKFDITENENIREPNRMFSEDTLNIFFKKGQLKFLHPLRQRIALLRSAKLIFVLIKFIVSEYDSFRFSLSFSASFWSVFEEPCAALLVIRLSKVS